MKFIILAAGKSQRLFNRVRKIKCLIKIHETSLICRAVNELKKVSKNTEVIVVTGFQAQKVKKELKNQKNVGFLHNRDFYKKEMLHSFYLALRKFNTDLLFCYSDIIFSKKIITKILQLRQKKIILPIKSNWKKIWTIRKKNPYKDAENLKINKKNELLEIGTKIKNLNSVKYQYMGMLYIPRNLRKKVLRNYDILKNKKNTHLSTFLNHLIIKNFQIKCIKTKENWYEFDDYQDLVQYHKFFKKNVKIH